MRRLRIVGGVLIGASVASVAGAAIAGSQHDCSGFQIVGGPALPALAAASFVSLPLIAGGISPGIGVKRGRRLKLEAPHLAVSRHGASLHLGARF